ncbi:MAG: hypothetical protein AABY22_35055, partial [Nanoarchaeota archaeon]
MKVKITNTIKCASTGITFHKGKVYSAIPAANQKRSIRFVNKKTDISISKIFVQRGKDSMLVDENDFVIIDFPKKEHDALFQKYYDSKTVGKKVKKVFKFKLRENYRPIEFN